MLIELTLTHPCNETILWAAGSYTDHQGCLITHCPGCREALGAPFVRAEETRRPAHAGHPRLHLQAS